MARHWAIWINAILLASASAAHSQTASAQGTSDATSDRVYSSAEVDTHAAVIDDGTRPVYPEALRPLGIGGKVLAQFIVDTAGRVDTTSILFADNSQPLFAASVRQVLGVLHFTPALKGGRKVAEEIEESFVFKNDEPPSLNVDSVLKGVQTMLDIGPAVPVRGSAVPRYPEAARTAGFSGEVDVQVVIDTAGRADMQTLKITSARSWRLFAGPPARPDPTRATQFPVTELDARQAFIQAVRDALPRMEFMPARANGRNVRQLVSQPFTFTIGP